MRLKPMYKLLKNILFSLAAGFLIFNTLVPYSLADNLPIVISSSVDKPKINIGGRITYTVTINYDNTTIKLIPPASGLNLSSFEIKGYKALKPKKEKNKIIQEYKYILTAFNVGEFKIDSLTVNYINKTGEEKSIKTQEIPITVEGIKPSKNDKDDIRDIKAPLYIKLSFWHYLAIILIFLTIIGLGLLYRRVKNKKSQSFEPQEPARPAEEIAYEELEKLNRLDLIKKGEIKVYYIILSEIIRTYIEQRFNISVLDRTTHEVYQEIRMIEIDKKQKIQIKEFLEECDLVKFAKYVPEEKTINTDFITAKDIIAGTKPVYTTIN